MSVELTFGETTVMLADEFEQMGMLAPPTIGGTPVVLHLTTDDVDTLWECTCCRRTGSLAVARHVLG
jgi:PhnB protein